MCDDVSRVKQKSKNINRKKRGTEIWRVNQ